MTDLAFLIPVLRRPHRVAPMVESINAATPVPHRILFVASPGDVAEHDAVRASGADLLIIERPVSPGDYARKINAGYRATDEPLLFMGADDIHFHPGWFEAAAAHLSERIHAVGTNDLANRRVMAGEHSTHTLVCRFYADAFGTIDGPGSLLHEGYWHEYVDDEFVGTARSRDAFTSAQDSFVEHLHANNGKAPMDDLYAAQKVRMRAGKELFLQRWGLWGHR